MTGGTGSTCSSNDGILASSVDRVQIQGPGTIVGYLVDVDFFSVNDSQVQQLTLSQYCSLGVLSYGSSDQFSQNVASGSGNGVGGLEFGSGADNRVANNTAEHNGDGITLLPGATDNHVNGNDASNNSFGGIALATGATANKLHGNTALGNGLFDLADANPNCDSNDWNGNHFHDH